jgi:hypothetical protein
VETGHLQDAIEELLPMRKISTLLEPCSEEAFRSSRTTINGGAIIDHEAPRERGFVAVEK